MWELIWLIAIFLIAIALTSRIWYRKNKMDIPYKFFNLCWTICLVYTFIKGWLFFIALGFFWIAKIIKDDNKDKDGDFVYWPQKNKR